MAIDANSSLQQQTSPPTWRIRAATVVLHAVYIGVLFIVDSTLKRMLREEPWYVGSYFAVLVATLALYFFTSGSSPGYVIDAMRAENSMGATFMNSSSVFQQSLSKNAKIDSPMAQNLLERLNSATDSSPWLRLVTELYPPGSTSRDWTCQACKIIQPPRAKHCVECDKCILQFDHHCVWLGNCVGQRNHCQFWWYILLQTILCFWTSILYITYLRSRIENAWWKDFIMVILLASLLFCLIFLLGLLLGHSCLALTNQTTYEVVRKKRILYMRGVPEGVWPFNKGICRNLHNYCCSFNTVDAMEAVPPLEELETQAKPYTCIDIVSCRCC